VAPLTVIKRERKFAWQAPQKRPTIFKNIEQWIVPFLVGGDAMHISYTEVAGNGTGNGSFSMSESQSRYIFPPAISSTCIASSVERQLKQQCAQALIDHAPLPSGASLRVTGV
jgi:hypothetical protein